MPLDLPPPLERVQIRIASLRGTETHYSSAEDPSYQPSFVGAITNPGMLPAQKMARYVTSCVLCGDGFDLRANPTGMMGRGMCSLW